ncbi:glycosyltransferase family 2 protein [Mucilaginibacter sp. dw_454]|uniref:glycosyltransferase family 2 protein n=1 Tax=Mucilaginibacter sp. dw_454 TaxID=2720079 RepID=UPI001BD6BE6C|nr:glycosyltransferase family 2 protein [Mucilaginibacter sp. dw_454]
MTEQVLTVIIPAYNEAANIPLVIPGVIAFCEQNGFNLIVVNDGSTDNSKALLNDFINHPCCTVIHHKLNRGYGGAIKSGIEACQTDYLVTIDCDGQHVAENIHDLYQKLIVDDADMVVGSRKGLKADTTARSFGKRIIRSIIKMLMPLPVYDINSGMKMYRTDLAKRYCKICPDSMAFSDVICLTFINKRHRVTEIPIHIEPRKMGKSNVTVKTAFHTVYEVFNMVVLFNPIRIFLPVALLCIICGIVWGIPILLAGRGVSVGSMLAIVLGVIILFFAAIAEQLSQIRKRDL